MEKREGNYGDVGEHVLELDAFISRGVSNDAGTREYGVKREYREGSNGKNILRTANKGREIKG